MFLADFWRQNTRRLVALALIICLFWFTRLPTLSANERATIASHFSFTPLPLPELTGTLRFSRSVHPSMERHSAWISAVGASVGLNDLDGDGLPNDVCYVDTRTNQVNIAPVPGTTARYQPFVLEPSASLYRDTAMAPMGCLPGDLNEDGLIDILVYYWGRTPIAFLKTASSVKLESTIYVQQEIVTEQERWYTNAATFSDLDGDGHTDLIIGNYFPDNAEVLNASATGVESMQHSMTRAYNGGRNRLLLWKNATMGNKPKVQFQEAKEVLNEQIANAWTLAVGAADLDGDLLPEIYFANDFGPDRLLHNRSKPGKLNFALLEGKKTLTTPNSKVLGHDSFKGMGVDFGDVNGDGLLDIYVSNIAGEYSLEESHFLFTSTGKFEQMRRGVAPYIDRSESLGLSRSSWGWETKFGDFDNDGVLEALQATGFTKGNINRWPELHELAMGNDELLSNPHSWFRLQTGDDLSGHGHNPFFVRANDGRYYDFAKELGMDTIQVTRGIATADVDGDGDLDFAVANQWDSSVFYRNESSKLGTFLGLKLLLPVAGNLEHVTGRPAIGANATVHLPDGRKLVAQVDGGNGHSGARSSEILFGLGDLNPNTQVPIDIQWRDSSGRVHESTRLLSSGWHTVLLNEKNVGNSTEV
ncbi:RNA-binding protein [Dulcicalothrix desertica PCC 7102]|uniref:RNA-binding protein n=1 Tax=Dulcicalothrix desertica PCC 7102 TaxID=232991 RepID=A0A433V9J5_9CYAN|nr:CRTAC1 family protein [Dulcicalothrix desertica]RUT02786.1 RNA-binding protein [Dulcicalothrix desertica PCC 7102]TWH38980.1 VCBS repeat protein [Dulcicalothrix desertica PCC 7102]